MSITTLHALFSPVAGSLCTVHLSPRASLPSVVMSDDVTIESDSILSAWSPVQPSSSEKEGAWHPQRPPDTLTHACAQGSILTCD